MRFHVLGYAVAAIAIAFVTPSARAADRAEPETPGRINLVSLVGYGASSSAQSVPNVYGFGAGVRGGYTLPSGIYGGLFFMTHSGYSVTPSLPAPGLASLARGARMIYGAEIGYDWETPRIVYRIYFGGGGLYDRGAFLDDQGHYVRLGASDFALWPGVTALVPLRALVVGADVHLTLPGASDGAAGLEAFAVAGTRF